MHTENGKAAVPAEQILLQQTHRLRKLPLWSFGLLLFLVLILFTSTGTEAAAPQGAFLLPTLLADWKLNNTGDDATGNGHTLSLNNNAVFPVLFFFQFFYFAGNFFFLLLSGEGVQRFAEII